MTDFFGRKGFSKGEELLMEENSARH
jgi:hypothetical protein